MFHGHVIGGHDDHGGDGGGAATQFVDSGSVDEDGCASVAELQLPSRQSPCIVPGRVLVRLPRQVFARTASVLEMGMCGGPVVDRDGACVGFTEGIVPANARGVSAAALAAIENCAVFVDAPRLALLTQLE